MKVAVITGASGGIGASMARQLAATGKFKVGIIARREEELRKVLESLGSSNGAMAVADVTQKDAVAAAFAKLKAELGPCDVLINNVGQGDFKKPSDMEVSDLERMMLVNVHSVVMCNAQVLPEFMKRNAGQIVTVSSVLGRLSTNFMRPAYNAAKHALNGYLESLRFELAADPATKNITISIASPGPVATDFGSNSGGGPDSRSLESAQPVDECAAKIVEMVLERKEECYTQEGWWQKILAQYARWGAQS